MRWWMLYQVLAAVALVSVALVSLVVMLLLVHCAEEPSTDPAAAFMPDFEFEAAPPTTAKLMGPEEWLALVGQQQ